MKLFILKYIEKIHSHEAMVLPNTDYHNPTFVHVDFFVGCALAIPESYTNEEYQNVFAGMVGSIVEIKDDTFKNGDGIYLPSEKDIV